MIAGCIQLAEYVVERLKELEKEISTELWIHCSTLSLAVVFRKPNTNWFINQFVLQNNICKQNGTLLQDVVDQLIGDLNCFRVIKIHLKNNSYYQSLIFLNLLYNFQNFIGHVHMKM